MKRVLIGAAAVGLVAAGCLALPHHTSAAETHSDCIQFDSNGNFSGLTPNCSETIHGPVGPLPPMSGVDPCNGQTGTLYLSVAQAVYHITVNGASDAWDTGTTTGTLTFVPDDSSQPSGSGKFTNWFGDEFNRQNVVQPDTFGVEIHFSNGQTATMHVASNIVLTPTGAVISVNHVQANCN